MKQFILLASMLFSLGTFADTSDFQTRHASHGLPDDIKKTVLIKKDAHSVVELLLQKNDEDDTPYYAWLGVKKENGTWDVFDIGDTSTYEVTPTQEKNIVKFRVGHRNYTADLSQVLKNDTILLKFN